MLYPAWDNLNPIVRGYSWDQHFLFKVAGAPVDLTGYTLKIELLEEYDSTSPVMTMSVAGGHVVLSANGNIDITMTPVQTEAVVAGTYCFVASLTYPDGITTYPVLIGKVNVVTWDKAGS